MAVRVVIKTGTVIVKKTKSYRKKGKKIMGAKEETKK